MDSGKWIFPRVKAEGWYTLEVDGKKSRPFRIGRDAYIPAAWKTLNFSFQNVVALTYPESIQSVHMDVMSVHPDGRRLPVCGGVA